MAKQTTDSFPEEREEIILDILKKQGKVRVTEVCDILSIAPSTARLLLQGMQDKGLLQRTHGGGQHSPDLPVRQEAVLFPYGRLGH